MNPIIPAIVVGLAVYAFFSSNKDQKNESGTVRQGGHNSVAGNSDSEQHTVHSQYHRKGIDDEVSSDIQSTTQDAPDSNRDDLSGESS